LVDPECSEAQLHFWLKGAVGPQSAKAALGHAMFKQFRTVKAPLVKETTAAFNARVDGNAAKRLIRRNILFTLLCVITTGTVCRGRPYCACPSLLFFIFFYPACRPALVHLIPVPRSLTFIRAWRYLQRATPPTSPPRPPRGQSYKTRRLR
jgi:hypothetical protein